ncbi:MAG: TolC family protein [Lewinellaceae bacterium]|nr:TolC family protein [Lewinellaceae bacterium]
MQVAQAYLNILLTEEQVISAKRRNDLSTRQLDNTLKMIAAGALPLADRYTIDAQIARDEQALIVAENSKALAYLTLKQLLQLEPDYDLQIERPFVQIPTDVDPMAYTLPMVYNEALGTQPNVRAAGFRINSAEEGVKLAKSGYYPTLSLFANLSSNYSTQFKDFIATGNQLPGAPTTVDINGQQVTITVYQPEFTSKDVKYFDQLDRNFGQGVGVSLNVPIYQNGRTRLSVERARLNVLNAQMQDIQTKQQLKNDIQTAIANARAGKLQLDAAQRSFQASQIAFQNTEKRQQVGAVNILELSTAKTNMDIAENELLIAKYDYIFRLKILDFYEGKPLSLR